MPDEFFSFDEALDELRLKEEELKRLVSEGEIRAFRKGDTMKLRRSDVESLRSELQGGEVVDLGEMTEELVFEDDTAAGEEAGMATQEIADVDTLIDDDVDEIGTLDLEIDELEDLELDDDDDDEEILEAAPVGGGMAEEEEEMLPGWALGLVFVTSVMMLFFIPIAISISTGRPSGVAKAIGGMFSEHLKR
ncbi:MAG: hypothetical protein ACI8QC_002009 [Planctomycetota bacterium]